MIISCRIAEALCKNCPDICELELYAPYSFQGGALDRIIHGLPHLEVLEISNYSQNMSSVFQISADPAFDQLQHHHHHHHHQQQQQQPQSDSYSYNDDIQEDSDSSAHPIDLVDNTSRDPIEKIIDSKFPSVKTLKLGGFKTYDDPLKLRHLLLKFPNLNHLCFTYTEDHRQCCLHDSFYQNLSKLKSLDIKGYSEVLAKSFIGKIVDQCSLITKLALVK